VHALAAAAAVLAVLAFATQTWRNLAKPAHDLADIEAEIASVQTQVEKFEKVTDEAASVERWLATDVNWLDELEEFARRVRPKPLKDKEFPVENDIVITQVILSKPAAMGEAGGQLKLEAKAKNDPAVRDLEQQLRDARHRVKPGFSKKDTTVPGYPQAFELNVRVMPPAENETTPSEGPK
jgi:hypothetical protein